MSSTSSRVALIWMPLASNHGPSLGLSSLKAALTEKKISCDIYYFSLQYAKRVGVHFYRHMIDSFYGTEELFGEWLFSPALFPKNTYMDTQYIQNCLLQRADPDLAPLDLVKSLLKIQDLREDVSDFISDCFKAVDWSSYDLIGFSLMFHQTNPSLALAREIKNHLPEANIIFGGASCFDEMGVGLMRIFPYIDFVCNGEGEQVLPLLVEALAGNQPLEDIQGIISRETLHNVETSPSLPTPLDMDSLPYPDYEDYFKQLQELHEVSGTTSPQYLIMETSRGCRWGEKQQCTFCGFNYSSCVYRSKSPERALAEISFFHKRYSMPFTFSDTLLDHRYLKTLFPELVHRGIKPPMFWEIRPTLTREEIKTLARSGVTTVQPGIESFSDTLLQMMNKGTTALQNIQTLKWCKEFGVLPIWYIIFGFPGEDPTEYNSMAHLIPLLVHLDPPACNRLRLLRFSTYLKEPQRFGLQNIVPIKPFQYIYHSLEPEMQSLLTYQFQAEYDDQSPLYINTLREAVKYWKERKDSVLDMFCQDEGLRIIDTRSKDGRKEYSFHGLSKDVYLYCDKASTIEKLKRDLQGLSYNSLQSILKDFVDLKLMVKRGDSYLSLAVRRSI